MSSFHTEKTDKEMLKILERIDNAGIYKVYYSVDKNTGKINYNLKLAKSYLKYFIITKADQYIYDIAINTAPLYVSYFLRKYDYAQACVTENARCGIISLYFMKKYLDSNLSEYNSFSIKIEEILFNFTERNCSFYDLVKFTKELFETHGVSDDFYNELLNYIMTYMFSYYIDD